MTVLDRGSEGRRARRAAALAPLLAGSLMLAGCGGGQSDSSTEAQGTPTATATKNAKKDKKQTSLAFRSQLDYSPPIHIRIPSIGVSAPVNPVGLEENGTIEEPPLDKPKLTGWYKKGPSPGENGPAVILGHVDSNNAPAVFYKLDQLQQGDKVKVRRADLTVVVFEVTKKIKVDKDNFPTEKVYGDLSYPGLRLITCGGTFNEATGHYRKNIIVFAKMTTAHKAEV